MKKLIGITGAILLAYVILSAIYAPTRVAANTTDTVSAETVSAAMFTARDVDDRIAVFAGNILIERTDTRVSHLPKIDRIRLREGIELFSEKELKEFLEDYCS